MLYPAKCARGMLRTSRRAARSAAMALVGERPADVTSATVALQLDRYHLEVAGERGEQVGEAALDRPERAVEQYQRMPVAMTLAVQLQRAHVDVAVKARRHPCAR
jgi:hypothetical protein